MSNEIVELTLTSGDQLVGWRPAIRGFDSAENTTTSSSLDFDEHVAHWVVEVAKKLDALARRQRDWDSYDGLPLQRDAKRLTLKVLGWLRTLPLPVPSVILGSGGTVHLEWRAGGKELEVELGDAGRLDFVKVLPDGEIEEGSAKRQLPSRVHDLTSWLMEN